jgi:hypothetical protein
VAAQLEYEAGRPERDRARAEAAAARRVAREAWLEIDKAEREAARAGRQRERAAATAARREAAEAAKGPWGGARPGAGRPRLYGSDAERKAAWRARRRAEGSGGG